MTHHAWRRSRAIKVPKRINDERGDTSILEERRAGTPVEIGIEPIGVATAGFRLLDPLKRRGRQRVV